MAQMETPQFLPLIFTETPPAEPFLTPEVELEQRRH
jgi:hypothetical protein